MKNITDFFRDKKVLITGGGGTIGTHLAKLLFNNGVFVRVADINWLGYMPEPYYSEKMTLDLRNFDNCLKATKDVDFVFHLAANMGGIGFITKIGADIMRDSSMLTNNMLEASVKNNIDRFFFSSSACVYPEHLQMIAEIAGLKESDAHPANPDTFYGWEKLFGEKMCEAYKKDYGLETRVARYHNIFGPFCTWDGGREKAPAALCRKVAETPNNGTIVVWGDGKQTRSFCYVDDCVTGTLTLIQSNHDKPLNIGSDRLVTIDELTDIAIKISGKNLKKTYDLSAPQGVRGRNADLTLVKKVLNWKPSVSLEEGMGKTYKWIETQVNQKKEI